MLKMFAFLLALQAGPPDRLEPILERWRSGPEDERLQALRDAASLRKEAGDAALAKFAEPPLPQPWTRPDALIELVSREKIPSWYGLLVPLLSSGRAAVRTRALEELGRRDLRKFSGPVVPLLRDADRRVAWQAAYTLLEMEARDRIPEIAPLLKDPEQSIRPNVLHVLGLLGDREHGPLLAPLLEDADPDVAIAAVQALGRFQAREYAGKIVRFLEASEPSHRQAAIVALSRMGASDKADKIAEKLADAEILVRWEAIRALGRLKARRYAAQIVAAVDDDGGLAPGLEAMGALGLRELSPHILPFLKTPDPGIRWRAVRALGDVDAKDDADRVAEMLKDDDSYVRLSALRALAAMGAREHSGAMLALLHDEEPDVCQGAAEEAGLLVNAEQIKSVLPLLEVGDSFVRWNALHLLVGAGAKHVLPSIAARLRGDDGLSRDVLWAIGRLDGREQRDKVAEALKSDDGLVRQQAAFALARISERTEELEAAERAYEGGPKLAAGFALVRLGRKNRAAAAALLREFVLRREEPDYPLFPDEIFDALAAGFEKDLSAALSRELKAAKRIESVKDLEGLLSKAGIALAEGAPDLQRRLPAGLTLTASRALEWCFGADARIVPEKGKIAVMETSRALEHWQKRLDAP
jgi:HEAT repeat protein